MRLTEEHRDDAFSISALEDQRIFYIPYSLLTTEMTRAESLSDI